MPLLSLRAYLKPGDFLLLALVFAPLLLAESRLSPMIGDDVGDSLLAVGRASGILGLSMILLAGCLSVRLPGFDALFGGLTRLWKLHHLLGFGGFVLVFAHVELLAISALPISRELPARILFPSSSSTSTWIGWLALVALTIFLVPSFKFFGPPRYQGWKFVHMVAAPSALCLAFVHAVELSPDESVWWGLGFLAAGSVAWRRVGSKLVGRLLYKVDGVENLAPDVVEISLRPVRHGLHFEAGQFVYVTPTDRQLEFGLHEEHPFSLSSAPRDERIRLGIKDLGDATHALQRLHLDSVVWVEGPYGKFFARDFPRRGQLWLGGGIGITPMVGGARAMAASGTAPPGGVHLFYLADSAERAYYLPSLFDCARRAEGLQLTQHYFTKEGVMTAGFLARHCPDFVEREVYVCGPQPMLAHLRCLLKKQGVPGARIHSEEFTFL
jgi:predicted ferric reductase